MKIFKRIICGFKDHVLQLEKTYFAGFDVYKCLRCNKKFCTSSETENVLVTLDKKNEQICDEAEAKIQAMKALDNIDFQSVEDFLKSLLYFSTDRDNNAIPFTEEERLEMQRMYEELNDDNKDSDT